MSAVPEKPDPKAIAKRNKQVFLVVRVPTIDILLVLYQGDIISLQFFFCFVIKTSSFTRALSSSLTKDTFRARYVRNLHAPQNFHFTVNLMSRYVCMDSNNI